MSGEDPREVVNRLPELPGIYRFYDVEDTLIYVGKAKNLKKRAGSYFTKLSGVDRKTRKLVSEIRKVEFTIANSEYDALLMENNFIKEYQPKYNILLKDDKTFPYLCIVNERFPRIIYTRKYIKGNGEYFGPYSSVAAMKSVLELVRKLYTIRTCNLALSETNIAQGKFKVCLEYHIGNCKGPCENLYPEEAYLKEIREARNILKGDLSVVRELLISQMHAAASELDFETAQRFKDKLEIIDQFQVKSLVVNRQITDTDVVTINTKEDYAYVNFLRIKEGSIVYSKTVEVKKRVEESEEEILSTVAHELRQQAGSINQSILSNVPILVDESLENVVPKIGDKRKLIELSLRNALELRKERELLREGRKSRQREVLEILQRDMQLKTLPKVIECFDNSNLQGTNPVASMVRFVDGKPDKKGYRHFNIKTVVGANDFASMKEIVTRRYTRLLEEKADLPDLIIVDGGKGQLSMAVEALQELNLYGSIPIAGIAKKLEEIYYPGDPFPLLINKKSPGLHLLQFIRDEAHRFAITFHRLKRSKSSIKSSLEELEGVGSKTIEKLLREFKSIKNIRNASVEELIQVLGESKGNLVYTALKSQEKEKAG